MRVLMAGIAISFMVLPAHAQMGMGKDKGIKGRKKSKIR